MRKQVKQIEKKVASLVKKSGLSDIHPAQDRPVAGPGQKDQRKGEIGASELFSLFTANIIKEDVVFTR